MRSLSLILGIISSTAFCSSLSAAVVPTPKSLTPQSGANYEYGSGTRIVYSTRVSQPRSIENSLFPLAEVLAGELELITGIKPDVVSGVVPDADDISLEFQSLSAAFAETEAEENQAYTLEASSSGLSISSQYYKGVSYGTASLIQLLEEFPGGDFQVSPVVINDEPTAEYRTIMLDVARKVHSINVIKDVIRTARLYKLRYVQLHLTDDQNFTYPFPAITDNITGNFTYTRQQLIDLVAYADARGVTLIPELDLPGHSSKIKQSNYLSPDTNDADIAAPANYAKIEAIIDDMLGVFTNTPYFHIGGDESQAGSALEPFLGAMNEHLRGSPVGGKRRMLVWEGFSGAPISELPATGDDRVIVLSWESTYNAPWNLLNNGYQIINASWKPMYVVGGGTSVHPGASGGRKFFFEDMYRWDKDTFMHWEVGRPVYNDSGPSDPNLDDGEWSATYINRESQVIGGQLLFWEQEEDTVLRDLRSRAPILSQRLWNPDEGSDFDAFQAEVAAIDERVMTIVQPVEILPFQMETGEPVSDLYTRYEGDSIDVTLRNRTKIPGLIRFNQGSFSNDLGLINFNPTSPITAASSPYTAPFSMSGGFALRAQLFRNDGTAVDGDTWSFYNNWEQKVIVTEYDLGRTQLTSVPDLNAQPASNIVRRYNMPLIRGLIRNIDLRGQKQESMLSVPENGDYEFSVKTQSGRATLYIDLNRNGSWESNEIIIENTPTSEVWQRASQSLTSDAPYRIRIDHATGIPRPVVSTTISGPGIPQATRLAPFLSLPADGGVAQTINFLMIRAVYADTPIPGGNEAWLTHLEKIAAGTNAYWQRHSYGKINIEYTITDAYALPENSTEYPSLGSVEAAFRNAASADHNLSEFDTFGFFFPVAPPLGAIGGLALRGKLWMAGQSPDQGGMIHEYGHTMSLGHAGAIEGDIIDGSPTIFPGSFRDGRDGLFMLGSDNSFGGVSRNFVPTGETGAEANYSTINFPMRYKLGVVGDEHVQSITSDGTYRLYEFEIDTLPQNKKLGLRFSLAGKDWWISFDPKMENRWQGFNSEGYAQGIMLHELSGEITRTLDFTPGSQGGTGNEADYIDIRDGALQVGSTFTFPSNGFTIAPVDIGTTDGLRYIDVAISGVPGAIIPVDATLANTEAVNGTDPWSGGRTPPIWRDRNSELGIFSADEDSFAPNNDYLLLKTTIDGLVPGNGYEIFIDFAAKATWAILAGLSESTLEGFAGSNRVIGGRSHIGPDDASGQVLFTGETAGDANIYRASLGIKIADTNGEIEVFIDDPDNAGMLPVDQHRAWYDGVAYRSGVDINPPTPILSAFSESPSALGTTEITMSAAIGSDESNVVEYRFIETSGNTGGSSSAWQNSPDYTDSALTPNTQYGYTVQMRDFFGNENTISEEAFATTTPALLLGFVDATVDNTEAVNGTSPWSGGRTPPLWRDRNNDSGIFSADEDSYAPINDYLLIKTTITGLSPGKTYAISLDFGTKAGWAIMGGLDESSIEGFARVNTVIGANQHIGIDDSSGRVTNTGRTIGDTPVFRALLGEIVASPGGTIEVFIDDPDNSSAPSVDQHRAWYDGLFFQNIEVTPPYETWISRHYPGETNLSIIGFTADPKMTGTSNGHAFLTATSPLVFDPDRFPTSNNSNGSSTFEFRQSELAEGISSVQYSDELSEWSDVTNAIPGITITTESGGFGTDEFNNAINKITVTLDNSVRSRYFIRQVAEEP